MSGDRDPQQELRDSQRMENRHAAEKQAEERQRLRDVAHDSRAMAAGYGVDSSDVGLRSEAFDDALEIRRRLSGEIERCEALDPDARGRLAHELRLLDLSGDDPGAEVDAFVRRFRAGVGGDTSDFEVRGFYRDLDSLKLYADLSRLDPD